MTKKEIIVSDRVCEEWPHVVVLFDKISRLLESRKESAFAGAVACMMAAALILHVDANKEKTEVKRADVEMLSALSESIMRQIHRPTENENPGRN